MYDITDPDEVSRIVDILLNNSDFVEKDNGKNQGWRSGSIIHYACFTTARAYFINKARGQSSENPDNYSLKKNLDKNSLQQIFYGAPGTGKSYTINHTTGGEDVIRTTFHPDTDYSTFVGAYKPTTIEETVMTVIGTKAVPVENADGTQRKESKIVYEFVAQAFLQAYVKAWKKYAEAEGEPKKQFLVIEEINRGNCAQIFGDLFQLLDRNDSGFSDYPIQADADMKRQLQKAFSGMELTNKEVLNDLYEGRNVAEEVMRGDILLLPSNLYIWATMNTSDQSLFPIDSAFKRRWDWTYMPISNAYKEWAIEVNGHHYDWWHFLELINAKIGTMTSSEDKKLGYFFCKAADGVISAQKFVGKVIFYLWNDVFKDYEFGDAIFNDEDGSKLSFDKFYTQEGRDAKVETEKVALFLKNLGLEPLPSESEDEEETSEITNVSL
ncbi:AAA family ATPase [Bacteroides fluxus]|uniref:AAA family ATPase n=1 Tax=Bacteroides fluxus TaxID=626930 RepID=UPI0023F03909|nr:AAA family ATPase [Bacteroides fluxus]